MNDEAQPRKWLSFDPTIHAGHVITAVTIICCAIAQWFGLKADISKLQDTTGLHDKQIEEIKNTADKDRDSFTARIDRMSQEQKQEVGKLRDDMNGWFMALDQKLDRKADKR